MSRRTEFMQGPPMDSKILASLGSAVLPPNQSKPPEIPSARVYSEEEWLLSIRATVGSALLRNPNMDPSVLLKPKSR